MVAPGSSDTSAVYELLPRLTRTLEAIEDRDLLLAEGILYDLVQELERKGRAA
jgi:hypothetical protein